MHVDTMKTDLHQMLRGARASLLWKLDGLSEYDRRRPMTPSGTNVLGLVKHLTLVEMLYLGWCFDRELEQPPSLCVYGTQESSFWALPDQSSEVVTEQYRRACAHVDVTIESLPLDPQGVMPWGEPATLHHAMVHVIGEAQRHLGHADIVRESIDGAVGLHADVDGIWSTADSWAAQHDVIEQAA